MSNNIQSIEQIKQISSITPIVSGLIDKIINMYSDITENDSDDKTSFIDFVGENILEICNEKQLNVILLKFPHDHKYFDELTKEQMKICCLSDAILLESFNNVMTQNDIIDILFTSKKNKFFAYNFIKEETKTKYLILKIVKNFPPLWKKIPSNVLTKEEMIHEIKIYVSKHNYMYDYIKYIDAIYFDKEFIMDLLSLSKGEVIGYIDEIYLTEELKNLSLEYSKGKTLRFFNNPSYEQRLKALSYHWDIFNLLKNPTEEETRLYLQLKEKIPANSLPRFIVPLNFDLVNFQNFKI